MHELGELGSSDVRVRVTFVEKIGEFVSVKMVERNQIGLAQGFDLGWIRRESFSPKNWIGVLKLHHCSSGSSRVQMFEDGGFSRLPKTLGGFFLVDFFFFFRYQFSY